MANLTFDKVVTARARPRQFSLPAWLVLICIVTFSVSSDWVTDDTQIRNVTAFWNLIGAAVFGFLINPPIFLYYSQGLNTTPIHAHSALFGVYGSLAIALMLFALREIIPDRAWDEKNFNFSFWWINGGLGMMMVCGLIPNGFYQLVQSVNHGTWYARSAEVIGSAWMQWTVWLRILGDIVFSVGALILVFCVIKAIVAIFQQPTQAQSLKTIKAESASV